MNKKEDQKFDRRSIFSVVYIFLGLFVLMMGYYTYFMIVRSNDIINSSYNKRQEVLAQRVIRGEIISADGKVLAKTVVDQEGNETREYPYNEVFAHVVGRYEKGVTGIEESENIRMLTSNINTFEKAYHDLVGEKSLGNNIVTTLNTKLQQIAYDALGDYRGAVVVLEPSTGRILAMVSKPAYDPNDIADEWTELIEDEEDESPFLNRATQGLYPPGSTFKIMTALEYMRENPSYQEYEYDCDSSIEYEDMVIHCNHNTAHGEVDLTLSLSKSCNTSFSNIGQGLDLDRFHTLCGDFLFNTNLPISMAYNPSSFPLQKANSSVKEAMQTAIGQGNTLITPMLNAMIVSTIANDGVMMKPYAVDRIENAYGSQIKKYSSQVHSTPMTAEEAEYMTKMMREVVKSGTAKDLKDIQVKAAGKTGSADHGEGKAHSWFVGFAPYDNPKIAVSVIVENAGTGSEYAVPIASKIFDAYFN
jgi:peptidoglycan glycosyltransferase